jgi:hypothetical protein
VDLSELFPVSLHVTTPAVIGTALAATLGAIPIRSSEQIIPRQLFTKVNEEKSQQLKSLLCWKPNACLHLSCQISEQPLSMNFFEAIGDIDSLFIKGSATGSSNNPEIETCRDGSFSRFL